MNEPTEADLEMAGEVAEQSAYRGRPTLEKNIAAALANERDKARAPFLRLLERLDKPSGHIGRDREAVAWMADLLRAAAQEQL